LRKALFQKEKFEKKNKKDRDKNLVGKPPCWKN